MSATVLFQIRGTQLNAYHAAGQGGITPGLQYVSNAGQSAPVVASLGDPSVFGGEGINLVSSNNLKSIVYPLRGNFISSVGDFAVLCRIVPNWATGNPAATQCLYVMCDPTGGMAAFKVTVDTSSKVHYGYQTSSGSSQTFVQTAGTACSFVNGVATDILLTFSSSAGVWTLYQDGTQLDTITRTAVASGDFLCMVGLAIGSNSSNVNTNGSNFYLNEFVIWSGIPSLSYPRSAFITATQFDASQYTDPGASSVSSLQSYTFAGVSETGTAVIPSANDVRNGTQVGSTTGNLVLPSASQVESGVTFDSNNSQTGTLTGGSSVDPGNQNVKNLVPYEINGVPLVGTLKPNGLII